jgi:hypothetical protein
MTPLSSGSQLLLHLALFPVSMLVHCHQNKEV